MHSAGTSAAVESAPLGQTPGNSAVATVPAASQPVSKEDHFSPEPDVKRASTSGSALMEFAVLGLLLAGAIGILKAIQMENPLDVLLCLLGSLSGCGLVCWVYFRRD